MYSLCQEVFNNASVRLYQNAHRLFDFNVILKTMLVKIIILLSTAILAGATNTPVVSTKNGPVQGITKKYHGEDVLQIKRIPYATPPVGKLRFAKPERYKNWQHVLNGTKFGPSCIQYILQNDEWLLENTDTSEDCLHLNVFVPRAIDKVNPKAVMVWIHGGGFTAGQGTLFDASYLALQGDVIVVTMNYRLGLLGFMSTEDDNAGGNFGIWDQQMAIEWVHENAENFGGDKNRITIFGESAGGYSVGLHTIISSNNGHFQRAISQSGAVFSPRALASDSKRVAIEAGKLLNCTTRSMSSLINCMRTKSASDILKVQNDAAYGWDNTETFLSRIGPVMDGKLIVDNPTDLLQDPDSDSYKFFQSLDIMAGTNNAEGGLMYWSMMNYQGQYSFNISEGIPKEVLCNVLATRASRSYFDNNNAIAKAICDKYSVQGNSLSEQGRSAVNVYADLQFVVPTLRTLLAHVPKNQTRETYHYIFTHTPSFPWIQSRPPWLQGANHAGELPFVFGLEAMYPVTHEKPISEMRLSRQIMTYWSNFAKTGNPNKGTNGTGQAPVWPPFDQPDRSFMNLTEIPHSGTRLYSDRVTFWTEAIPTIVRRSQKEITTKSNHNTNDILKIECSTCLIFFATVCVKLSVSETNH